HASPIDIAKGAAKPPPGGADPPWKAPGYLPMLRSRRVGACPFRRTGDHFAGTRAGRQIMALDDKTRPGREAAVFRRVVEHLRKRTAVQNIDLMNLAGFCRNCLSNWMKEEADKSGVALGRDESREAVYGMPYDEWKTKYQRDASKEQQ